MGAAEQGNYHRQLGHLLVRARGTPRSLGLKTRGEEREESSERCSTELFVPRVNAPPVIHFYVAHCSDFTRQKLWNCTLCTVRAPFLSPFRWFTILHALRSFLGDYACRSFIISDKQRRFPQGFSARLISDSRGERLTNLTFDYSIIQTVFYTYCCQDMLAMVS